MEEETQHEREEGERLLQARMEELLEEYYTRKCSIARCRPNITVLSHLTTNTRVLSLRETYIGDTGAIALASALWLMPSLYLLDLSGNGISNTSVAVYCKAVQEALGGLRILNLSNNKLVTRKGGHDLLGLMTSYTPLMWVGWKGTSLNTYYSSRLDSHSHRRLARWLAPYPAIAESWERHIETLGNSPAPLLPPSLEDEPPPLPSQLLARHDSMCELMGLALPDAPSVEPEVRASLKDGPYDETWEFSELPYCPTPPILPPSVNSNEPTTMQTEYHAVLEAAVEDPHNTSRLFLLIDEYTPKTIQLPSKFIFPGDLYYVPAVGSPDCFVSPPAPSPFPTKVALHHPPPSHGLYWSFLAHIDTTRKPELTNPNHNLPAALAELQTTIYQANIAPPQQAAVFVPHPPSGPAPSAPAPHALRMSSKSQYIAGLESASDARCLSLQACYDYCSALRAKLENQRKVSLLDPLYPLPIDGWRAGSPVSVSSQGSFGKTLSTVTKSASGPFSKRVPVASRAITFQQRQQEETNLYLRRSNIDVGSKLLKHDVGKHDLFYLQKVVRPVPSILSKAGRLTSGALNSTGSMLVTGSFDMTGKVWDAETGHLTHVLEGHEGYVYDVIWNAPFCDRIVTASFDRTCKVWDSKTGTCLHSLVGHDREVVCICCNQQATLVASGSMDETAIVWSLLTGSQITVLHGHSAEVISLSFSSCGKKVVTGSADKTVRLWNALTGECLSVFKAHREEVTVVKFNVYDNLVLSCSSDRTCRVWDVYTSKGRVLHGHTKEVTDCLFSPDGWLIASASEDTSARIWDTLSGRCNVVMKGHTMGVCSVSFCNNGTELVTGSSDMTCRRWKVQTGECLQILEGHKGVVISSFSSDGNVILTISKDNTCMLWRRDPPDRTLKQYLLRYICGLPIFKADLLSSSILPIKLHADLIATEHMLLGLPLTPTRRSSASSSPSTVNPDYLESPASSIHSSIDGP